MIHRPQSERAEAIAALLEAGIDADHAETLVESIGYDQHSEDTAEKSPQDSNAGGQ